MKSLPEFKKKKHSTGSQQQSWQNPPSPGEVNAICTCNTETEENPHNLGCLSVQTELSNRARDADRRNNLVTQREDSEQSGSDTAHLKEE